MEKEIDGFRVPVSYMFIDDKPELYSYISKRTVYKGNRIGHDFANISAKDICLC